MRVLSILALVAALGAALAPPAGAAPYDGSRPLLCAVTSINECDATGRCERATTSLTDAPRFFRIDVPGRRVVAAPSGRASAVKATASPAPFDPGRVEDAG